MSIVERIKNFLKKFNQKQELLTSEIGENVGLDNDSNNNNISENGESFDKAIKIDINNILDPVLCKGDKFVYNILLHLGVDKRIINNPIALKVCEDYFRGIVKSDDIKVDIDNPTQEQIDYIIEKIKKGEKFEYSILRDELKEIKNGKSYRYDEYEELFEYGIIVDEKTGAITLNRNRINSKNILERDTNDTKILPKDDGNILGIGSAHSRDDNSDNEEKVLLNEDGIVMEWETRTFKSKNEENKRENFLEKHIVRKICPEYPFMHKVDVLVDNFETKNTPVSNYELSITNVEYPFYNFLGNKQGAGEWKGIDGFTCEDMSNVKEFYKKNKEIICNAMVNTPGYEKLAIESGLLSKREVNKIKEEQSKI